MIVLECGFTEDQTTRSASEQSPNSSNSITPLDLLNFVGLMKLSSGKPEIMIGLIDGPVFLNHPNLSNENIREIPGKFSCACTLTSSTACMHGTFVAGILCGERGSKAPSICPDCTLLVRPIFAEPSENGQMPSATPDELAEAIIETVDAGANVINLSAALAQPSSKGERKLEESLDYAAMRGTIIVAAAGNQGTIGSSAITRHPWVIPVIACDNQGRPLIYSNLGSSIGRRGLSAPGDNITSLGTNGKSHTFGGTSAAAPFVTGAIALLWSEFPSATSAQVKLAVAQAYAQRRATVVPPLLDVERAYQVMKVNFRRK